MKDFLSKNDFVLNRSKKNHKNDIRSSNQLSNQINNKPRTMAWQGWLIDKANKQSQITEQIEKHL